jgi:hypothetical protein
MNKLRTKITRYEEGENYIKAQGKKRERTLRESTHKTENEVDKGRTERNSN